MRKTKALKTAGGYLKRLVCSGCGKAYQAARVVTLCQACGEPVLTEYDTEAIGRVVSRESFADRESSMWRYREFLPLPPDAEPVSLREGCTPLFRLPAQAKALKLNHLWLKDESRNPGFTFKARGMSAAVSMARSKKLDRLALRSAGNAAAPFAAYTSRAGLKGLIVMPKDAPELTLLACEMLGARVQLLRGTLEDCVRNVQDSVLKGGYFDLSSYQEPYRLDGDKTLGFEIAEAFSWELPDWVVYPGDGGLGFIGMWKAWRELEEAGLIGSKRPKLMFVQGDGCAPIVRAFENGDDRARPVETPAGIAAGLRVGNPAGDNLILRALNDSKGAALAVPDDEIVSAMRDLAQTEGVLAAPEGAATLAGLRAAARKGLVGRDESVVLVNTNTGLKYANVIR